MLDAAQQWQQLAEHAENLDQMHEASKGPSPKNQKRPAYEMKVWALGLGLGCSVIDFRADRL
jgi:hypothetical protein